MKVYAITVILVAYFVGCGFMINDALHSIRVNSFKLGCMNAVASYAQIEACKELAEEKVSHGK
jgi:hypothetical protein